MADEPQGIESRIEALKARRAEIEAELGQLVAKKNKATVDNLEDFESLSASQRREIKETAPGYWRRMMEEKRKQAEGRLARSGSRA